MTGDRSVAPVSAAGDGVPDSTSPANLADRAARGAGVTLSGQGVRIGLQFAGVVVLARLLNPHDYGLLAMVVVIVGVGEVFRDFGLPTAAVQARTLNRSQRDALLWVNVAIGLLLSVIALASAPLLARGFGAHQLTHMVQASAVVFAANGLAAQYRADLTRRLCFGRLVVCDVVAQATGLGLGIALAVAGTGYWALVAQLTGQSVAALIGVMVSARWLPRLPRRDAGIGQFLGFGKNLAFSSIVYYVANNLDTLTIAVRLGPVPLGIYNRAFSLLMSPLNQLRSPATTVALPVLSKLQDDHRTAGEYLKRGQLAFGYTIVAGLAICAGSAVPVVHLTLGAQWSAAAPVLAFLAIAGGSTMLAYVGYWAYLSRGLGRQLLRYTLATFVLQAVCIVLGSTWGVNGVAGGYMVAAVVEWPASLCWLSRLTYVPLRDLLRGALRVALCGAAAGCAAWLVTHASSDPGQDINVLTGLAAGLAVYAVAALVVPQVRADLRDVVVIGRRMMGR